MRRGGDDQDASSGPDRSWAMAPAGRPEDAAGLGDLSSIGLGVCRSGGSVLLIFHDWAKADMQAPREEKRRDKTYGVISKFRISSERRTGNGGRGNRFAIKANNKRAWRGGRMELRGAVAERKRGEWGWGNGEGPLPVGNRKNMGEGKEGATLVLATDPCTTCNQGRCCFLKSGILVF